MSEFDTTPTDTATALPVPQAVSLARADLALEAVKAVMRLAMELFPAELRAMKVLDDLTLCYRILARETQ